MISFKKILSATQNREIRRTGGRIMDKNKKEMLCYLAICIVLIIIVILNNVFWKLGKETNNKIENNIDYLESNNVIYNVPYEEKVLD